MTNKLFTIVAILFITLGVKAQTNYLVIGKNILLPKDSIEKTQLTSNLNDFLFAAQKNDRENQFVLPSQNAETQILLDEIQSIENGDSIVFSPYLTNLELLEDRKTYSIHVVYMAVVEQGTEKCRRKKIFLINKIYFDVCI